MNIPSTVKLVEVGPRDGLQNELQILPVSVKLELIERLSLCGFSTVEATSFVSPRWIPQMADHLEIMQNISAYPNTRYPVLVPNLQGLESALTVGVQDIAVFTAASETFTKKNINCTIDESFARFEEVFATAQKNHLHVRGYVSCALGCPYEGEIQPESVVKVAKRLFEMGCEEISIGDTIGVGTALKTQILFKKLIEVIPVEKLAGHFHDTYGQAIANIFAALQCGIRVFDSAVAGLGGCPYARGASGNVASEDVVYLMNGLGIESGIHLERLIETSLWISKILNRPPRSKVALAQSRS